MLEGMTNVIRPPLLLLMTIGLSYRDDFRWGGGMGFVSFIFELLAKHIGVAWNVLVSLMGHLPNQSGLAEGGSE